jgi:hypothetical protein
MHSKKVKQMKSISLCMLCTQRKQWIVVNQFHFWCSCKVLIPNNDTKMHSKKLMQLRIDVCCVCAQCTRRKQWFVAKCKAQTFDCAPTFANPNSEHLNLTWHQP